MYLNAFNNFIMGYNPYQCIICGVIEDNGWGWTIPYDERINIMKRKGVAFKYSEYKNYYVDGHIITLDVCDCCFRKGPSIKDPFFNIDRTKAERIEYWKNHNKKNKN